MSVKQMVPVTLITISRLVLGGVFLWSGLVKTTEIVAYDQVVRTYDILPDILVQPFAVVVPWIEIIAGVTLLLGVYIRSSALFCLILLFSFEIALGINVFRGANFSCGCFGFDRGSLLFAMIQNFFLLGIGTILVLTRSIPLSINSLKKEK